MSFKPGDIVQSVSNPARIGVVTEVGVVHGGIQFYRVNWSGTVGFPTVPESDLRLFKQANFPHENLVAGKPHKMTPI
ncbi:MAG: hypothetical protein PCFJNLEI_01364 [Verrucomicrobiae bacterium]|nr:hypothetical protein [Verrucomicrobiae bacterium]